MFPRTPRVAIDWHHGRLAACPSAPDQIPRPAKFYSPHQVCGCENADAQRFGEPIDEGLASGACGHIAREELNHGVISQSAAQLGQPVGVLIQVFKGQRATGKPDLRLTAVRDDVHRSQAGHPVERQRHLLCRAPVSRQDDRLDLAAQPGDELLQVGNVRIDEGDFFSLGAHGAVSVGRFAARGRTGSASRAGRMVGK